MRDPELHDTIKAIQVEEMAHLEYATQSRRSAGFGWLELLISAATEGLIWLSTRGDSERLAEQLADHHSR